MGKFTNSIDGSIRDTENPREKARLNRIFLKCSKIFYRFIIGGKKPSVGQPLENFWHSKKTDPSEQNERASHQSMTSGGRFSLEKHAVEENIIHIIVTTIFIIILIFALYYLFSYITTPDTGTTSKMSAHSRIMPSKSDLMIKECIGKSVSSALNYATSPEFTKMNSLFKIENAKPIDENTTYNGQKIPKDQVEKFISDDITHGKEIDKCIYKLLLNDSLLVYKSAAVDIAGQEIRVNFSAKIANGTKFIIYYDGDIKP